MSILTGIFFQFHETLLTTPGVNASTCSGLGYADADSGLKVALKLSILHTGSSISAGDIETSLLEDSVFNEDNTKIWRKANGDSITVDSNGINVQGKNSGCMVSFESIIISLQIKVKVVRVHGKVFRREVKIQNFRFP